MTKDSQKNPVKATTPRRAVALHYDQDDDQAPIVTAMGEGPVAEKIIEVAKEHGIFIDANPLLAEALSQVEVDDQIPIELYQAVAEIIGFVLKAKDKMPGAQSG